ncbi:hypothetical protein AAVH_24781 [Aphelenchoides avenae]|nr:hypothetical protein AAVH_24781 [Aphelenchus avenae]
MVRSVTLVHERSDDENLPQSDTVETLGQPRHTDVATPHSAFVKDWRSSVTEAYGVTLTESSVAELFVFENAKASKKLDVFVWTIEQLRDDASTALHYAFLLQVVDMK